MNNPDDTEAQVASMVKPSLISNFAGKVKLWLADPKAPVYVGGLIVAAAALVGFKHYFPNYSLAGGNASIVVFDPVRFINAQRAVASILATNPSSDKALVLTQVAKQAEAVIKDEARGAAVIVKQAVVNSDQFPDITERVMVRFGLPTGVPTITNAPGALTLESMAPTDSAFSPGKIREDYRMELERRDADRAQAAGKAARQENALP